MKRIISIAAVTLLAIGAGCSNTNSKTADSKVLTPTPAAPVQPSAPEQASSTDQGPLYVDTHTPSQPAIETGATTGGAGGTYVVKHGDTLFHIATVSYGSGGQWKKIAAANPGVDPKHLKVGQKLIIP